jgi:hypothetical protein
VADRIGHSLEANTYAPAKPAETDEASDTGETNDTGETDTAVGQ